MTVQPEARAREKIDRQLTDAGWIVQDRAAANLSAGPGLAVREFPLKGGPVDYLLYLDGAAAGAVEAKKEGWTLSGVEQQSKRTPKGCRRPPRLPPAAAVPVRVDSSHMDAAAVLAMSKWVVAELVRLFHGTDTATASAIVDSLTAREIPFVWEYDGRKIVLTLTVGKTDAALLMLSSSALPVSVAMLSDWMEAKHMGNFRRDVILPLRAQKLALLDPKDRSGASHAHRHSTS